MSAWQWLTASDAHVGSAVIVLAFAIALPCLAWFGITGGDR